jgi:MT-A70
MFEGRHALFFDFACKAASQFKDEATGAKELRDAADSAPKMHAEAQPALNSLRKLALFQSIRETMLVAVELARAWLYEHELGNTTVEAHAPPCDDLIRWARGCTFATILADPPWRFQNSTGEVAPEHWRLRRYATMSLNEILALPVNEIAQETAHVYLWVPNAMLPDGLRDAGLGLHVQDQ